MRRALGEGVNQRIAGVLEKAAEHHVDQHAIKGEFEFETDLATGVPDLAESPAT
jgi:hypothetical protein